METETRKAKVPAKTYQVRKFGFNPSKRLDEVLDVPDGEVVEVDRLERPDLLPEQLIRLESFALKIVALG